MMINKIAVCPICGKRTWLRIQDGGFLNEYPIRVHCMNCRALLKGTYIMTPGARLQGLTMYNADMEECDVDSTISIDQGLGYNSFIVKNADYVAEISGELPCKHVCEYTEGLPLSPFLKATDELESVEEIKDRIDRLTCFANHMEDWNRTKSIAFQLLDEGSIDYIAKALKDRLGHYVYECDHYLKSIHCLQEVVLEETKYLFLNPSQDDYILEVINEISQIDQDQIHQLCQSLGGIEELMRLYRRAIEVFSGFMGIYPSILPAETYMRFKNAENADTCISTCSFLDVKTFYQDAYESLLSLLQIPVCLDNIVIRGDFQKYNDIYNDTNKHHGVRKLLDYLKLDKGTRINKLDTKEYYQKIIDVPADKNLRNGIGHNSIEYDGISQIITIFDIRKPNKPPIQKTLMDMAVDCIGLARSSVVFSEMILFLLREELRRQNITTLIHPRYYKNAEPNMKCPCGSNRKYKKCCRNAYESLEQVKYN